MLFFLLRQFLKLVKAIHFEHFFIQTFKLDPIIEIILHKAGKLIIFFLTVARFLVIENGAKDAGE